MKLLGEGLANIFCEELDSKYFQFCGSYSFGCNYSFIYAIAGGTQTWTV